MLQTTVSVLLMIMEYKESLHKEGRNRPTFMWGDER